MKLSFSLMMLSDPTHGDWLAGTRSLQSADGADATKNPLNLELLLFFGENYLNGLGFFGAGT